MVMTRRRQAVLGSLGIVFALVLALFVIPTTVSTPSNVPKIVLSPLFWPGVLAALIGIVGLGLVVMSRRLPLAASDEVEGQDEEAHAGGVLRLVGLAALMLAALLALPVFGMVWTSIALFVATAFLVRTRNPVIALASAVLMPLLLYAFFAHVAGVAIPQGSWAAQYVRLP